MRPSTEHGAMNITAIASTIFSSANLTFHHDASILGDCVMSPEMADYFRLPVTEGRFIFLEPSVKLRVEVTSDNNRVFDLAASKIAVSQVSYAIPNPSKARKICNVSLQRPFDTGHFNDDLFSEHLHLSEAIRKANWQKFIEYIRKVAFSDRSPWLNNLLARLRMEPEDNKEAATLHDLMQNAPYTTEEDKITVLTTMFSFIGTEPADKDEEDRENSKFENALQLISDTGIATIYDDFKRTVRKTCLDHPYRVRLALDYNPNGADLEPGALFNISSVLDYILDTLRHKSEPGSLYYLIEMESWSKNLLARLMELYAEWCEGVFDHRDASRLKPIISLIVEKMLFKRRSSIEEGYRLHGRVSQGPFRTAWRMLITKMGFIFAKDALYNGRPFSEEVQPDTFNKEDTRHWVVSLTGLYQFLTYNGRFPQDLMKTIGKLKEQRKKDALLEAIEFYLDVSGFNSTVLGRPQEYSDRRVSLAKAISKILPDMDKNGQLGYLSKMNLQRSFYVLLHYYKETSPKFLKSSRVWDLAKELSAMDAACFMTFIIDKRPTGKDLEKFKRTSTAEMYELYRSFQKITLIEEKVYNWNIPSYLFKRTDTEPLRAHHRKIAQAVGLLLYYQFGVPYGSVQVDLDLLHGDDLDRRDIKWMINGFIRRYCAMQNIPIPGKFRLRD